MSVLVLLVLGLIMVMCGELEGLSGRILLLFSRMIDFLVRWWVSVWCLVEFRLIVVGGVVKLVLSRFSFFFCVRMCLIVLFRMFGVSELLCICVVRVV